MNPSPLSAVIVTLNSADIVREALRSVAFCDEIIAVDLGSTDDSVAVLKQFKAQVHLHTPVPIVEEIKDFALSLCRHDWILFIDPDERIDPTLAREIQHNIAADTGDLGVIAAPSRFYFKEKPLRGTCWGQADHVKQIVLHRHRASVGRNVHSGYSLKPGCRRFVLPLEGDNVIHHYWMNSVAQLVEKHRRYLLKEGEARYALGLRYSYLKQGCGIFTEFYLNFIQWKGYRDGWVGLFLSAFKSWYTYEAFNSLRRYQRQVDSRRRGRGDSNEQ
jgi:glycosyltransferase involved in cell wall biosynthesis